MPTTAPKRKGDEALLQMLHMRDFERHTADQIATVFGLTRSAVLGKFHRLRHQEVLDCTCRKAANRDGGMPERWWAA